MSREKIYALLRQRPGTFFSGEELSRELGISRAAVWKAIDSLRRDGYTCLLYTSQEIRPLVPEATWEYLSREENRTEVLARMTES